MSPILSSANPITNLSAESPVKITNSEEKLLLKAQLAAAMNRLGDSEELLDWNQELQ
jgi:hypothetical protein